MKQNCFVRQTSINDCGVACLTMILKLKGVKINYEDLKDKFDVQKDGMSAYDIIKYFKKKDICASGYKKYDISKANFPIIAHVLTENNLQHFVVVKSKKNDNLVIYDPAKGIYNSKISDFNKVYTGVSIVFNNNEESFFTSFKENKYLISKIIFLSLIFVFLSILVSYLTSFIINLLLLKKALEKVLITLLIFFLISFFKDFILHYKSKLSLKLKVLVDKQVTMQALNRLFYLPYSFYQKNASGELISKVNDLSYIKEVIIKFIEVFMVEAFLAIFSLLFIFITNYHVFLVSLLYIIVLVLISFFYNKSLSNMTYDLQIRDESLSRELVDSFNGILTIKNLCKEKYFTNKISQRYESLLSSIRSLFNVHNSKTLLSNVLITFITVISIAICIITKLSVTKILFILSLQGMLINSGINICSLQLEYSNYKSTYERVKTIFKPNLVEKEQSLDVNTISCANLNYKYNSKMVLNKVNLIINKGDRLLVTGKTGSGKSTLFKLITKQFYSNKIFINNKSINEYSDETIRKNVTYVDQKARLFLTTIKENIALGKKDVSLAVKTALVEDILKENNVDYNYLIDGVNSNLSGGQIQKLVIAQTLLNSGSIIIFDETTNQLDVETERIILSNINKYYKDKTVILISHRNSNVDMFNKQITIQNTVTERKVKCKS
ncbi:MAG: cysteine peptidase family C39 domain-containing protein [Bacilli bacterium]